MGVVDKYLQHYAEPLARQLCVQEFPSFNHCLVIPSYNETPQFAKALAQGPLWQQRILVVVVVNQPQGLAAITEQNHLLLDFFAQQNEVLRQGHCTLYCNRLDSSGWLVINACTELAPPEKQGVGLARKLGCDAALSLWHEGKIASPWLHSSDADARLPHNYFELPVPPPGPAAHYQFRHVHSDPTDLGFIATAMYENAISYYAKSLVWAGSPYGFSALGSALAFTYDGYARVRGFPKRSGGEDFYLLNKLAKLGPVLALPQTIEIEARLSERVPFGTGPAAQAIVTLLHQNRPYCYYSPECFIALKTWLDAAPKLWPDMTLPQSLPVEIQNALLELGVLELLLHIQKQGCTAAQTQTAINQWFDAFKTLKFIRFMQSHHYPARPLQECIAHAVYCPSTQANRSPDGRPIESP